MRGMFIAWNAKGHVVERLDEAQRRSEDGEFRGQFWNFAEHEAAGGAMTDILINPEAVASGSWPEWLGRHAFDFRVEVDPAFSRHKPRGQRSGARAKVLVHLISDHRRERAAIEAAISGRANDAGLNRPDLRSLIGGPSHPLRLDEDGKNKPRPDKKPLPERTERVR